MDCLLGVGLEGIHRIFKFRHSQKQGSTQGGRGAKKKVQCQWGCEGQVVVGVGNVLINDNGDAYALSWIGENYGQSGLGVSNQGGDQNSQENQLFKATQNAIKWVTNEIEVPFRAYHEELKALKEEINCKINNMGKSDDELII